ncbi:MAG: ArsR/SmtB family transcription factor [Bacillota bacterium]
MTYIEESKNIEVSLEKDRAVEFIMSLARLGNNELIEEIAEENRLELNPEIKSFIKNVYASLEQRYLDVINRYFSQASLGIGLALLAEDEPIEDFIEKIKQLSDLELTYYLLVTGSELEFSQEDIREIKADQEIFSWIEENFAVTEEGKWQIMRIFKRPAEVKAELIDFLSYYYDNFYQAQADKTDNFLAEYITDNKVELKQAFWQGYLERLTPENRKEFLASVETLEVLVSYFLELGSAFATGGVGLVIGYRYPELIEQLDHSGQNFMRFAGLFKVLGDETRLQVLLHINEGSKYLTEIAEIMDSSNPAIKYHINKLMTAGLIEVESSENRIYYQVKRRRFEELIGVVEEVFLT